MDGLKKGKRHIGKIFLVICNILLVIAAVPVAVIYSNGYRSSHEGVSSFVFAAAAMIILMALINSAYILYIDRRLRAAEESEDEKLGTHTKFLSSVYHDIRTSLNAVLGMTELAQSHISDKNYVQECLGKISDSGNQLFTLANDILEISRMESGQSSINPVPFRVKELVSELEKIIRTQAGNRGIRFDVQIKDLPEPCLRGDKLRLSQIFLNLLTNAVKFTDPGGTVRFEVWEENDGNGGVVLAGTVSDTGIGMSPEFQKTMYEFLVRADGSRVDTTQGSGLGLAIVKRMVTMMNGTIDCVSAENAGTSFTVRIPLQAVLASEIPQPESEADGQISYSALYGAHVLVADDNDISWEIASEILRGYGVSCDRAENGRECVDTLNVFKPGTYDIVLMDVQMPVLNGFEATRELRSSEREDLRKMPIIAMTADAFAEDVQMCFEAGMDAHVAKPVEFEKVLTIICQLLPDKKTPGADV